MEINGRRPRYERVSPKSVYISASIEPPRNLLLLDPDKGVCAARWWRGGGATSVTNARINYPPPSTPPLPFLGNPSRYYLALSLRGQRCDCFPSFSRKSCWKIRSLHAITPRQSRLDLKSYNCRKDITRKIPVRYYTRKRT